jgi:uncharacterized membrane protein
MILLYILLILMAILVIVDLVRGIRITIYAMLDRSTMKVSFACLYPIFLATVNMENRCPCLSIYFLKMRLFTSKLVRERVSNTIRVLNAIKISNFELSTSYGFSDPFVTALVSGMLGIISSFVSICNLDLKPNFISDEYYVILDASANIKVGHTIWDYLKYKT